MVAFLAVPRLPSGEKFFAYMKDSFDWLYLEGDHSSSMMTIGLHARLLGRQERIGALHRKLDYMLGHDRVWVCRRGGMASHWAENRPLDQH